MKNNDDNNKVIPSTKTYGTAFVQEIKPDNNGDLNNNKKKLVSQEQQPKHSLLGIFFIMLGAFSFSVMFLIVKLMSSTNTFTLVFYRSLLQIILSYSSLIYFEKESNPWGPPEQRLYLILRAVFGAIAVSAFFFGIQILPLPDAVTLQFTTPPFAAAFAVCVVGEAWLPLDAVGAIVCFAGVALIAHPTWLFGGQNNNDDVVDDDNDASNDNNDGPTAAMKALAVAVCTGGAAAAGIAYVLVRKIGERASANVMVLYYGLFSLPLLFVGSGILIDDWTVWNDIPDWSLRQVILLLLMGLGGYGGQLFYNMGLQHETAATGTLVTTTQIVWTYVFELSFLHEPVDLWSLGGTALIMGYMLLVGIIKLFTNSSKQQQQINEETNDDEEAPAEEVQVLLHRVVSIKESRQ